MCCRLVPSGIEIYRINDTYSRYRRLPAVCETTENPSFLQPVTFALHSLNGKAAPAS